MVCQVCGTDNNANSKVCTLCGNTLNSVAVPKSAPVAAKINNTSILVCSVCGTTNKTTDAFCTFCGKKLKAVSQSPSSHSQNSITPVVINHPPARRSPRLNITIIIIILIVILAGTFLIISYYYKQYELQKIEREIGVIAPFSIEDVIVHPVLGVDLVRDRLIVFLKDGYTDADISAVLKKVNGNIIGYTGSLRQISIKAEGDFNKLSEAITLISQDPAIDLVNYDFLYENMSSVSYTMPNDPWTGMNLDWDESSPNGVNWGLEAIHALTAWSYETKMSPVDIGVIDSGFDIAHEDLLISANNANGESGIIKDKDHGTAVAGIIGAIQNNKKGLSGVVPKVKLHVYRCVATAPSTMRGIRWLLKFEKAKIINFSQGWEWKTLIKNRDINLEFLLKQRETFTKIITDLESSDDPAYHDFLIIQAAGNDGQISSWSGVFASVIDPEARKHILVVGAIKNLTKKGSAPLYAGYEEKFFNWILGSTNLGPGIDLVAPGQNIRVLSDNNSYESGSGTSYAAPFVTGTAGLVLSVAPALDCTQIRQIIIDTATQKVEIAKRSYFLVNAGAAVEKALSLINSTNPKPKPTTTQETAAESTGSGESEVSSTVNTNDNSGEVLGDSTEVSGTMFYDEFPTVPAYDAVCFTNPYKTEISNPEINSAASYYYDKNAVSDKYINDYAVLMKQYDYTMAEKDYLKYYNDLLIQYGYEGALAEYSTKLFYKGKTILGIPKSIVFLTKDEKSGELIVSVIDFGMIIDEFQKSFNDIMNQY